MDVTTLALAVDSSQVNSASQALQRMAGAGANAQSVAAQLSSTARQAGQSLQSGIVSQSQAASAALQNYAQRVSAVNSQRVNFSTAPAGGLPNATRLPTPVSRTQAGNGSQLPAGGASSSGAGGVGSNPVPQVTSSTTALNAALQNLSATMNGGATTNVNALTTAVQNLSQASQSVPLPAAPVPGLAPSQPSGGSGGSSGSPSNGPAPRSPAPPAPPSPRTPPAPAPSPRTPNPPAPSTPGQLRPDQIQQVSAQLNDLFVQIYSGGSPMTALIQQGSQLNGTFGGIGGTIRALTSLITPFNAGMAAAAAGIGTFAFAQYQASQQSKAFKTAIGLTGNFAGQTEEQFGKMANRIADSTKTSVASVREMATALTRTGQIGPDALDATTEAAVRFAKVTGKAVDEVKDDIAGMLAQATKDPLKFVDEQNKGGANLFSAGERDKIKTLQDKGDNEGASALAIKKWSDRMNKVGDTAGEFSKALDNAKTKVSQFIDALGQMSFQSMGNTVAMTSDAATTSDSTLGMVAADAEKRRKEQEEKVKAARAQAAEDAKVSKIHQDGTAAHERLENFNVRANPAEAAKKTNDLFNKDIADATADGKTYSASQIARMRLQNQLDTADPRVLQDANVNYSTRVQQFKDALEKEQAAITFHNSFLQGKYQAGSASLNQLYDDKVENIRKGTDAEIAELAKEKAATQQLLKSVIDPTQRKELQGRIQRFDTQKRAVADKGNYDEALARQEREAAQRAQDDQVDNFRANLKQSSGDDLGAVLAHAQAAERQNRLFAGQTGGKITDEDVTRQTALTIAAAKYADVQTRSGFVAQSTGRAEEAANLAAELSGKSLLETENDIYNVRSKAVEQLAKLNAEMQELARVSTDPKIKQAAADLALQYAKAAAAVDPALNRLRDAQKELSSGIAGSINSGIANLPQNYIDQRKQSNDQVRTEKETYNRKIEILEGYLATTRDKNDAARLREKIKNLEAQKDAAKGQSKGTSLARSLNASIVQPIAGQVMSTASKVLFTDPLQKYLENQFKSLTEGDNSFGKSIRDAMGIKDAKADPKALADQAAATANTTLANAIATQTSAVQASTDALNALANAANGAAGNATPNSKPLQVEPGSTQAAPSMGDFTRADRTLGDGSASSDPAAAQSIADARVAVEGMGATSKDATSAVNVLAQAAGKGGGALGLLPSIINTISSVMAAFSASAAASGASNSGGALASIFGKIGGSASAGSAGSDAITSYYFHTGGVVGGSGRVGAVPSSIFDGATRYHTGGIAGQTPDSARAAIAAALKHGEVPAILMKNEEVLRRDDPRHRANLGVDVFAKIMAGEKPWEQSLAAQKAKRTPDNSVASLLRNIAGDTKQGGENSASVLGGLLARMGVKDQDEPAVASALKVSGARELGGLVSAGKLYRVNEKRPELLNVSGKQYLMMGAQGGKVDANPQGAGGRPIAVTNNFTLGAPTNHNTQRQMALAASRSIADAARRNG